MRAVALVGVLALALAACGGDDDDDDSATDTTSASTENPQVTITATDYAFDMPDEVPAGYVEFTFVNDGTVPEGHHAQIVKLADDLSFADFEAAATSLDLAAMGDSVFVGGPNGGDGTVVAHLTPGNYAVVCVIPDENGEPHVAKGMAKEFTATEPEEGSEPESAATVNLVDFLFKFPEQIDAGSTIKVENDGSQVHELAIFKLNDGATLDDANAIIMAPPGSPPPEGPPPFTESVGLVGLSPGEVAWITDMQPGNYAAYCFFPNTDKEGGPPHILDGMVSEFTVS